MIMKYPEWLDERYASEVTVIRRSLAAQDDYGHCSGSNTVALSRKHIDALLAGEMLAWNDGEYSTFVVLVDDKLCCDRGTHGKIE